MTTKTKLRISQEEIETIANELKNQLETEKDGSFQPLAPMDGYNCFALVYRSKSKEYVADETDGVMKSFIGTSVYDYSNKVVDVWFTNDMCEEIYPNGYINICDKIKKLVNG